MVCELLVQIEQVDRSRHDRLDARGVSLLRLYRRRKPRCSAPLRTAEDDKVIDPGHYGPNEVGLSGRCLDRIHGADDRLGHGKMDKPFRVPRRQVLVHAVGEKFILDSRFRFIGEQQWLIRNLTDHGRHRSGHHRQNAEQMVIFVRAWELLSPPFTINRAVF